MTPAVVFKRFLPPLTDYSTYSVPYSLKNHYRFFTFLKKLYQRDSSSISALSSLFLFTQYLARITHNNPTSHASTRISPYFNYFSPVFTAVNENASSSSFIQLLLYVSAVHRINAGWKFLRIIEFQNPAILSI